MKSHEREHSILHEKKDRDDTHHEAVGVGGFGAGAGNRGRESQGGYRNQWRFETGDFTGWSLSGDWYPWTYIVGSTFSLPNGGKHEAQLGTNDTLAYLSQSLTTVPGQSYTLDYWMRTGYGGEEFQTYWNGTLIADLTDIPRQPWTEYSFTVAATGSSTELMFGYENNENWFHFDNVSVNSVPEPSALAMAGLGLISVIIFSLARKYTARGAGSGKPRIDLA